MEQRPQGRLDSPLTELGWAQAARYADQLSGIPFVRAYTSPLGRARLSAERVLAGRGVALNVLDGLVELDWGEAAGMSAAEREIRFPELKAARQADRFGMVFLDGESYASAPPTRRTGGAADLRRWPRPGTGHGAGDDQPAAAYGTVRAGN